MIRSSRFPFLIALLGVLALLCSGCTIPLGTSSDGTGGLTDVTVYEKEHTTLDEAMAALRKAEQDELQDLVGMKITQVMGVRVDREGKARTWTLGFQGLNSTKFLEFHAGDWTRLDLQLPLPEQEILFDQVLSPDRLYLTQKDRIKEALDRHGATESDLLLAGVGAGVLVADGRHDPRQAFRIGAHRFGIHGTRNIRAAVTYKDTNTQVID